MEGNPAQNLSRKELLGLVAQQQVQIAHQQAQITELLGTFDDLKKLCDRQAKRIKDLEQEVEELRKRSPTPRLQESYSLTAEEKRRDAAQPGKNRKKNQRSRRRGRISTAEKLKAATVFEEIWPPEFSKGDCRFRYSRAVWRVLGGRAVLVRYDIYAGPDGRVPRVPGVQKRGEFGEEIIAAVAWEHFIVGLPLDKVVEQLEFFWGLKIRKSQADRMLNRLAIEWLPEFDALCQLLAVSGVVYADETGWSLNSVWAFLSEHARITVFGCRKNAETLAVLLKKDVFKGILVSDDAAVYQGFSRSQKCWSHLLRKAIRLTLLEPGREKYRRFLDALLEIYRTGKSIAADRRMSEAGRARRVDSLRDAICDCTGERFVDESKPTDEAEKEFRNLVHEIVRLSGDDELFTYVIYPEADGTNNISERHLREPAKDRVTGQANKTLRGAQRRTVITSVLDSIRLKLKTRTLNSVMEELKEWAASGIGRFRREVQNRQLAPFDLPEGISSPLHLLIPLTGAG